MVARMMHWRPWPPAPAGRKLEARLVVRRVEGFPSAAGDAQERVAAEVRWKGCCRAGLGALRRGVKRNWTRGEGVGDAGVVIWDEEFRSVCSLTANKENVFQPWEIGFAVFRGVNQVSKNKLTVIGTATLNLAEFAFAAEEEVENNVPLSTPVGATAEHHLTLHLSLIVLELRTSQGSPEIVPKCLMLVTTSPPPGFALPSVKGDLSPLKAGLRKVKIFSELASTRKSTKTCHDDEESEGKSSTRSDDGEYTYQLDTDSLDDDDEESEDGKVDSSFRKSFSYGTLASANYVGSSSYSDMGTTGEYGDCIYYSHQKSDVASSQTEETTSTSYDQFLLQASKKSILPWKKRKLNFRSPKARGEPLLNKAYGAEGGDDIDFDCRQLSSSDESSRGLTDGSAHSSVSDFGDDNFVVGSWESKDLTSRDSHMKLSTHVFFASIDQRSERAAGESACTALVAVITDWFQSNLEEMPNKSEFDSLIREGSLQWRNLCENQTYRERFPDKHFDLDTVLQAKICPLSVNPGKSFVGFFHPEVTDDNLGFDFLHGAMSFDSIWDEISQTGSDLPDGGSQLFIVSWNDHFFVLKVERDAYYIIDNLGERLHEGCQQAYILKFNKDTLIGKVLKEEKATSSGSGSAGSQQTRVNNTKEVVPARGDGGNSSEFEEEIVCRGKESCKEYIKSFLAAIPIRELQTDIKKGLMASTPLHHRLQIEFHYAEASKEIIAASTCDHDFTSAEPAAVSSSMVKFEIVVA